MKNKKQNIIHWHNLSNHPAFHSEGRLVDLVRRREYIVRQSILLVYEVISLYLSSSPPPVRVHEGSLEAEGEVPVVLLQLLRPKTHAWRSSKCSCRLQYRRKQLVLIWRKIFLSMIDVLLGQCWGSGSGWIKIIFLNPEPCKIRESGFWIWHIWLDVMYVIQKF